MASPIPGKPKITIMAPGATHPQAGKKLEPADLPARLDHIAMNLKHIFASARQPTDPAIIVALLEDTYHSIACAIPDADPALAAELTQINKIIRMWKKSWVIARRIPQQRTLLAVQAWNWSNKIIKLSRRV